MRGEHHMQGARINQGMLALTCWLS
jgi:hypothetical protein